MSRLVAPAVSEPVMRHLESRAAHVVLLIEAASQKSEDKKIRDGGAQLIERIMEMAQDLREIVKSDEDGAAEAADVFHRRLYLAEKKIEEWNIPESVKKRILKKTSPEPAAKAPRRRRAPRKKAA